MNLEEKKSTNATGYSHGVPKINSNVIKVMQKAAAHIRVQIIIVNLLVVVIIIIFVVTHYSGVIGKIGVVPIW